MAPPQPPLPEVLLKTLQSLRQHAKFSRLSHSRTDDSTAPTNKLLAQQRLASTSARCPKTAWRPWKNDGHPKEGNGALGSSHFRLALDDAGGL
eukprot:scaffold5752_cov120-Cylindrotheca_fusiformis.AAC.5